MASFICSKVLGNFNILVDHSLGLKQMVDLGRYSYINENISPKIFPKTAKGKINYDTKLIYFFKYINSVDALKDLDIEGLRPATIEELLAFGAQYSEFQIKFPIFALGSPCDILGIRQIPYLGGVHHKERTLSLYYWDYLWMGSYSFLVIPK